MAQPVLVRAYTNSRRSARCTTPRADEERLPPVSAYTFVNILRTADTIPAFHAAIDGIAELCAKNRMSLADEYASHLPPLGEITAATSTTVRPHLLRPGMRRPLTSVPEAEGSIGSSEGSGRFFVFRKQKDQVVDPARQERIGIMGRKVSVDSTTAFDAEAWTRPSTFQSETTNIAILAASPQRQSSTAEYSLQRLLAKETPI